MQIDDKLIYPLSKGYSYKKFCSKKKSLEDYKVECYNKIFREVGVMKPAKIYFTTRNDM